MKTQIFSLTGSGLFDLAGLPRRRITHLARFLCLSLMGLALIVPAWAGPIITGVKNPPPNLKSTGLSPAQLAVADKATLVPVATFSPLLQATLDKQGFTAANNWTLVNNQLTLANNATFNITTYSLSLNAAGTAFGETIDFTLNPNLAGPVGPFNPPPTEHWLQYVNTNAKINNFGFPIAGQQGFWQVDNGQVAGGPANGPATGPYYDSNGDGGFSTPPTFFDFPNGFNSSPPGYAGVGTYLHFDAIPTWDIFTPAAGGKPASEIIDVGNYGLQWGFSIVPAPEPSSLLLLGSGFLAMAGVLRKRLCRGS